MQWNYEATIIIETHCLREHELTVRVRDFDVVSRDEELGSVTVPLNKLEPAERVEQWYTLDGVKSGEVRLSLHWQRFEISGSRQLRAGILLQHKPKVGVVGTGRRKCND